MTWRRRQRWNLAPRATQTRRQIVSAARRLFVASGYVGTTVEAIAAEAGVARATVYKAFGTRVAIVRELECEPRAPQFPRHVRGVSRRQGEAVRALAAARPDLIDEEAIVAAYAERMVGAPERVELIGSVVTLNRSLHERCANIIAVTRSGASLDASV